MGACGHHIDTAKLFEVDAVVGCGTAALFSGQEEGRIDAAVTVLGAQTITHAVPVQPIDFVQEARVAPMRFAAPFPVACSGNIKIIRFITIEKFYEVKRLPRSRQRWIYAFCYWWVLPGNPPTPTAKSWLHLHLGTCLLAIIFNVSQAQGFNQIRGMFLSRKTCLFEGIIGQLCPVPAWKLCLIGGGGLGFKHPVYIVTTTEATCFQGNKTNWAVFEQKHTLTLFSALHLLKQYIPTYWFNSHEEIVRLF